MLVSDFDFELPPALIAERPAVPREAARLLHFRDGSIDPRPLTVADLPGLLRPSDLLVFNDTRVIPARLYGRRERDPEVRVEALLLKPIGERRWTAMARPAKRLRPGDRVLFDGGLVAEALGRDDDQIVLRFDRDDADVLTALETAGAMPLPPYIVSQRKADARDKTDYQTVFAEKTGAIAAPTAGLHFTPALIESLKAAGIGFARVTLHVGAGTFLPVKVDRVEDHKMHAEWGEVTAGTVAAIETARARGCRVIAIGTTSLRLLESAARGTGKLQPFVGETDIFITPGFEFRVVDGLMTNFHLPKSTLLMLVAAFVGLPAQRAIYAHAVEKGFRFYSYGDTSLLFRQAGSPP
ncbi:MAG: tRNA preQ1(34) S-adenosylmethionine ribosyltransferase-isomerase QueA [Ferrovibrio sp.]|uniref:tRNA preQ1(34) S-adenosylmethionine ribosyltransferase-isomerase QueA n=1 Tax=Ferrovibrio sp. TaxID=1917215 RepID=UPI00260575A8|nr:tRNA preQ1(34) S-adenosylmethionine ribosyltransferase-isomerase QueA [Ferrovibrio sp.]MCW0232194.1 tRNA preQ1(34) S-adenosylmethionine ribosyltransferase-isomerase QueA [Ferrovibrio sp.]